YGGLVPELGEPVERTDEGLLGELAGELVVACHAVGQAVDPVHVHVVELALCGRIPLEDATDQESLVHPASRVGSGTDSVRPIMGHGEQGKGCILKPARCTQADRSWAN